MCDGRPEASPRVTIVKNRPIDRTVPALKNVIDIPAPAPRWSEGRLFMIAAWFGEKKRPIPAANSRISRANHT
jgi:hypothetical protein